MSGPDEAMFSREADGLSETSIQESDSIKVPVVRKLKPPPEIWELVHPVAPRQPGLGHAFITRFVSSRSMFILLVVVILCVGGFIGIRNGKRIAGARTAPVDTATEVNSRKAAGDKQSTEESNVPAPVVTSTVNQTTAVDESENPKRKASRHRSKAGGDATQVSNRSVVGGSVSSPEGSEVSLPTKKTRPSANTTETAGATSVDAVSTRKSSLSPQLIDSPKTSAPRKSKVIQWP